MQGFLGTRAWLLSDLTLIVALALATAAVAGWRLAHRRRFPAHCRLLAVAALLNWVPVLAVMVRPWVGLLRLGLDGLSRPITMVPLVHGVIGGTTQLLMTYTAVRMNWLKRLPPRRPHWLMVATLVLWLLATLGGSGVYLLLYGV